MERSQGTDGSGAPGLADGPADGEPVPDGRSDQLDQADSERAPRRH